MAKESKKIYDWELRCVKKNHKFFIESEEENSNKIDIIKISCPSCQGAVQFSTSNFAGGSSSKGEKTLRNLRRENADRSRMAMEAAAQHAQNNPAEKMTDVQYGPDKEGRGSGRPEKVPTSVIDSIKEKVIQADI